MENNELKVVFQMVVGRGGSLLLHSLLDTHPQVLAYPGILNFYTDLWPAIQNNPGNEPECIAKKMEFWVESMMPYNINRYLGKENNEEIKIDCKEIAANVAVLLNDDFTNRKLLFISLQYCIAEYFGFDTASIKVVYNHEHTSNPNTALAAAVTSDWPEAKFLCMLRDPRSNYIALHNWEQKRIEQQLHADEGHRYIQGLYADLCYYWYSKLIRTAIQFPDNFLLIRLEDLQKNRVVMLENLCRILGIHYTESMLQTTFLGKTWHGDNFSPKGSGIRNSADPKKWQSSLTELQKSVFEIVLSKELRILDYPFLFKGKFLRKIFSWLLFPFWFYDDWKRIFEKEYYTYMSLKGFGKIKSFLLVLKSAIFANAKLFHFIFLKSGIQGTEKLQFLS
ncbi:MAG: sulfotransferase [Bacteroidetes bacterium]|nr:sulfotransferase [Bacteroidota bacterium]